MTIRAGETVLIDGEDSDLWIQLENTSWLPIPWLELVQPLPDEVAVFEAGEWKTEIVYSTYLLPKQRVERKFRVRSARGLHSFDQADLHYGDGIGLRDNEEILDANTFLLVRPKMFEDRALSFTLKELVGEKSVQRWYQEDTSRLQGIRAYQPTDPYKNIHWQATAKVGSLMVKQYETTSETDFYVLLNQQFYEPYWMGTNRALVNQTCRLAATLLLQGHLEGCSFGLVSNASWPGVGGLTLPLARGLSALEEALDSIGSIHYSASGRFADVLQQVRGKLQDRATLIVITALWTEEIARQVEALRTEGHPIQLIVTERLAQELHNISPAIAVLPLLEEATANDVEPLEREQEVSA